MNKNNNNFVNGGGPKGGNGKKKPWSVKKRIILSSLWVLLAALLIAGGIFAYKVFLDPTSAFKTAGDSAKAPEVTVTPSPSPSEEEPSETPSEPAEPSLSPSPSPLNPYAELEAVADNETMKDIVNVGLFGIDYAPERTSGAYKRANKHFYTDVVMVMAVNFKKNTVDLISIPRDSYTPMPNKKGIYRIKEAFYFGGEMKNVTKGLENSMKAVTWQLGNIPVDYYIGVTMPVVKELVDIIGGVDYDVDVAINIQGRSLKKGMQHLNGQQALDYFRARKSGDVEGGTGDINRVNRQKDLLVAIFKKLKNTQLLLKMPEIIKSLEGKLYTNLSFEQLAALAVFGTKLDETKNIRLHSFEGNLASMFNWSFCFPNQENRVKIIKQVYGVTVEKNTKYTYSYAKKQWATMQAEAYVARVKSILEKDEKSATPKLLPDDLNVIDLKTKLQACIDVLKNKNSSAEAINKAKDALKKIATEVFKGKYKISWYVHENSTAK